VEKDALELLFTKKDSLEKLLDGFEIWVIFFGALVVLGVGGEVIFGARAWWNNRQLHAVQQSIDQIRQEEIARLMASGESLRQDIKASDTRIAEAQRGSAEANERAKKYEAGIAESTERAKNAEAQVASAKEQAAKAELGTVQARLELAKLQERMADRNLTDAQVKKISVAIKSFSGQEFDVTPYWDLPESLMIANRIADALVTGGWKYVAPEQSGFMLGGTSGVQIWTHPTADVRVKRAAESLLAVLNREGIVSVPRTQNPANPPDSKIHLNVGTKP
jgi:hypothetical protein